MKFCKEWSDALLKLVHDSNNFDFTEACEKRDNVLFYINGLKVGIIEPNVLAELQNYPDVFKVEEKDGKRRCVLCDTLSTVEERTTAFNKVLTDLRGKDKFICLKGWRNETYAVYYRVGEAPLCHVERAGCSLFGFIQYGVHINGYTCKDGEIKMWIGRRSKTKPTFPDMLDNMVSLFGLTHYGVHVNGYVFKEEEMKMWIGLRSKTKQTFPAMLDNMCAGGLASGLGVRECAIKESQEEASVDDTTLENLKAVGALSYCYKDHRGVFPETEYVFDLELAPEFVPRNADGEVEKFFLYTTDEIQDLIISGEFKPNCALVVVDFLMRHGYITADNEPNYLYLLQKMHRDLQPSF